MKEKRIRNYWLDKKDWIAYIKVKNKELTKENRISIGVAMRFRIAYNISYIIGVGGMASALFIPAILTFFVGSELGGKIFITWFAAAMFLIALIFFYESYMGFRYKLTGTLSVNSFDISKNEKGYLFAAVDEVRAPLWSIAMLILGIILIAIDILIYVVFY